MKRSVASAAWLLLGYTVLVIVWGGFVRATGSGAGCGSHWPLCNGQVIPHSPGIETLIELGHRLSSGLLGILVVGFVIAVFRAFPRGHGARTGAVWTLFFIVTESLLGAGLVTFEWVAADDSVERVYVMAFHLINTFLLLAALTSSAWFASGGAAPRPRAQPRLAAVVCLAMLGVLIVGASGAVTALGDTLLLREGVQPADSPVAARLLASRLYHPAMAIVSMVLVVWVAIRERTYGRSLLFLYLGQAGIGALNVYLKAPVWLQLVHLAVSDAIWILLVLVAATLLSAPPTPARAQ